MINIRINRLSSSKNIFNNPKEFYNESLYNSSYKNELKYIEANRHHINRGNNIVNKGHKNSGINGTNNNINIDRIRKTIYKNRY